MKGTFLKEIEVALECIMRASRLCQQVRDDMVSKEAIQKADKSPVTVADFGSQAIVCHILNQHFPEDRIVAEETSQELRRAENEWLLSRIWRHVVSIFPGASKIDICQWIDLGKKEISSRYWCLDPIDGTKGFIRGDQYAVALALVVEGAVEIGVLGCPNLTEDLRRTDGQRGIVFYAVKGEGAFQKLIDGGKEKRIKVQKEGNTRNIRFCESYEPEHSDHDFHLKIARRLGITQPSIRMDSQAKYGIVARGDASVYLRIPSSRRPDYKEKVWDHAAGAIIIEEAGGRVTDAKGRPLDFGKDYRLIDNTGIVATNGSLHDAVLSEIVRLSQSYF